MDSPLFTVIITSYNYGSYIRASIESVVTQSFTDWELLIVDDCSTDNSWAIIQDFKDPRIKSFRQPRNLGACEAYNHALSMSKGKFIACLDSDDWFMPNKLAKQAVFFEKHPNVDICGTFVSEIVANDSTYCADKSYESWFNVDIDINNPAAWIWHNRLCHSSAVIRKSLHDRLGKFENSLTYTPDWQFWLRALVSGARFSILHEKLTCYRNHGNNLTHKSSEGTLIEHARTSSTLLVPWLMHMGRVDLIDRLWSGFLHRSELRSVAAVQDEVGKLFSAKLCAQPIVTSSIRLATHLIQERSFDDSLNVRIERDAALLELYNIYHSKFWKFTEPLRFVISKARILKKWASQSAKIIGLLWSFRRLRSGMRFLVHLDFAGFVVAFQSVVLKEKKTLRKSTRYESIVSEPISDGQPLVSVIIPCFNYGRYVLEAVNSVLSQTLHSVEIIVVDGGSTDQETLNILKSAKRPRTQFLFRDSRHLVGSNRNYGINLARGRYICCLDADDTLDPTYLEKAVFHLETYGYDVVSTSLKFMGCKTGFVATMEYPDLRDMTAANHVLTCAVFRKSLWESVGGYVDVGIGKDHVAEDWDFWIKLAANGARIRNIHREALFNYRIHDGGSLSTSGGVKSIKNQQKAILKTNQSLLTSAAFENSEVQQAKRFRCESTRTALANSFQSDTQNKTMLLAMPYFLVGGAERLLSGLCEFLANNGWRIIVISTLDQDPAHGSSLDWFKSCTAEVYSLPDFLDEAERADFVDYLIASRGIQCVLNTGSRLLYELMPRLKKANPTIRIIDFLFNRVGHVKSHLEFKSFITCALAENPEVFRWYLDIAGWAPENISMVSSGVDLNRFYPRSQPLILLEKYKIQENELVVGFSGRLSREKAPDVFIEVAELCREHKNIRFIMTGGGPLADLISKSIRDLPSNIRIEFAGIVDDVDEYLALYDVLVLPSRLDGRPLVVMEALACGVPVVASAVGGLPDLVTNQVNGYLVPPADANAIATHLIQLADDKALLAKLKEGARTIAEERLDANEAYKGFKRAIEKAIDTGHPLALS